MADVLVPVHELKAKLSEYLGRTLHRKERIIICRRNKPIAMIIPFSQEDRQKDVTDSSGLEKVDWSEFSELADSVEAVYEGRQGEGYREVSFDTDIISSLMKGKASGRLLSRMAGAGRSNQAISSITVFEIVYGAYHTSSPQRFLGLFEQKVLPFR